MKLYEPPILNMKQFCINRNLTSLNDWLNENHLSEAGIVTYLVNS